MGIAAALEALFAARAMGEPGSGGEPGAGEPGAGEPGGGEPGAGGEAGSGGEPGGGEAGSGEAGGHGGEAGGRCGRAPGDYSHSREDLAESARIVAEATQKMRENGELHVMGVPGALRQCAEGMRWVREVIDAVGDHGGEVPLALRRYTEGARGQLAAAATGATEVFLTSRLVGGVTTSGLDKASGVATTKTIHLKVGVQMLRLKECDELEGGGQRCVLRQPLSAAIPEGAEWREAAATEARRRST